MTAVWWGGGLQGGGIEQKGKRTHGHNNVVIAGGRVCKGTKWQWKKYNKDYIIKKYF